VGSKTTCLGRPWELGGQRGWGRIWQQWPVKQGQSKWMGKNKEMILSIEEILTRQITISSKDWTADWSSTPYTLILPLNITTCLLKGKGNGASLHTKPKNRTNQPTNKQTKHYIEWSPPTSLRQSNGTLTGSLKPREETERRCIRYRGYYGWRVSLSPIMWRSREGREHLQPTKHFFPLLLGQDVWNRTFFQNLSSDV